MLCRTGGAADLVTALFFFPFSPLWNTYFWFSSSSQLVHFYSGPNPVPQRFSLLCAETLLI